jgi:hypothetical protein
MAKYKYTIPATIEKARALIRANQAKGKEIDEKTRATKLTNVRRLCGLADRCIELVEHNVRLREAIKEKADLERLFEDIVNCKIGFY